MALLMVPLLLIGVAPLSAQTYGSSTSGTFALLDQSMWGPGMSGAIEFNHFLGTSWNASGSIGGIAGSANAVIIPGGCVIWCWDPVTGDTRTGVVVNGSTSGTVGVDVGARINPGSVDVAYGLNASVTTSDMSTVHVGDVFTIGSAFSLPGGSISTDFASFEAWMDLQFELNANISSTACFIAAGCSTWSSNLSNIDVTQELLSFNRNDSGTLQVLGVDVPVVNFGEEIPVGPVGVTVEVPNLETTGGLNGDGNLASSGDADVLKVGVDVPALALDAAFPGSSALLGASVGGVGYSIFSSSLGPVFGIGQDFLFEATPMTTLVFDMAIQPIVGGVAGPATNTVTMPLGMAMDFVFPAVGNLGVTPFYWLNNSLTVNTAINLALDLEMSALELFSPIGNLGPLWEDNFRTDNLSFTVDQRTFAMNFDQIQGESFYVQSVVPEPITMILFGSGLLGVGGAAARRRRREDEDEELV